jgi:hypothetical protein
MSYRPGVWEILGHPVGRTYGGMSCEWVHAMLRWGAPTVQPAEPSVVATRAVNRGAGDEFGTTAASYSGTYRHPARSTPWANSS